MKTTTKTQTTKTQTPTTARRLATRQLQVLAVLAGVRGAVAATDIRAAAGLARNAAIRAAAAAGLAVRVERGQYRITPAGRAALKAA